MEHDSRNSQWGRVLAGHVARLSPEFVVQAADVASSLDISIRTLHRALAVGGDTFGALSIQTRVNVVLYMPGSPFFDSVTTAKIGRRAGVLDGCRCKCGEQETHVHLVTHLE